MFAISALVEYFDDSCGYFMEKFDDVRYVYYWVLTFTDIYWPVLTFTGPY